jgi:predicted glycogen debranching enzyme
MSKVFKGEELRHFINASNLEWLETNGLGGYASSTASGAHTRRYHGLLIAALTPPVNRTVVLSKLEETVVVGGERHELSANQYPGAVHPQGFHFLTSFQRRSFPEFVYEAAGVQLKKTIACLPGENTTLVVYEVLATRNSFTLELLPLCASRDYHNLSHVNGALRSDFDFKAGIFHTRNYDVGPDLFISVPGSTFQSTGFWFHQFEYDKERERGLDCREDLFNHGRFAVNLKKGDQLGVIISTHDPVGRNALGLFDDERKRRLTLIKPYAWNENLQRLALAASQFVVQRGQHDKTIIAGYHWFADWGRDALLSLPGLCLTTGQFEEAKKILHVFAASVSDGMLPNRFPDDGQAPEYNSVDATLWFFLAVYHYYQVTRDKKTLLTMIPVLRDIIRWFDKGTRYNIHVDADDLVWAGAPGVQLTWMDAKVGDWVVTPRQGKAVEVNALWYNALLVLASLLKDAGDPAEAETYLARGQRVKVSFNRTFWNESRGYLYDVVDGETRNEELRPNQIYAISLPFPLLPKAKAEKIFSIITKNLFTPRGLRSLSPTDPAYVPFYRGDQRARDGAYHQGTVWSFLLGAYVDALMSLKGEKGRVEAGRILKLFFVHLDEAGIGTVSEIFDGQPPHAPRGCIAQAWSVAELIRVALQYDLLPKQS